MITNNIHKYIELLIKRTAQNMLTINFYFKKHILMIAPFREQVNWTLFSKLIEWKVLNAKVIFVILYNCQQLL